MRFRELQTERKNEDGNDNDDGVHQGEKTLTARRDVADAFYSAAKQTIQRVLSGDSESFLRSIEQIGGQ